MQLGVAFAGMRSGLWELERMGSFADSSFPPVLLTPCHQGGILFCAMRGMIRISRTVFIAAAHNVVGHAHVAGDLVVGMAAGSTSGDALTIGHAKVEEALERWNACTLWLELMTIPPESLLGGLGAIGGVGC